MQHRAAGILSLCSSGSEPPPRSPFAKGCTPHAALFDQPSPPRFGAGASVSVSANAFIEAMRLLPAGVTIVTANAGGKRGGFTATAVCSVSAEPPHLLVCANRTAETHALIHASGHFAVNLLRNDQAALAERFGGRGGIEGEARFRLGSWTTLASGAPVLADACAVFDCRVAGRSAIATHDVIIGAVLDIRSTTGTNALVYVDREYSRLVPIHAG